MARILSGDLPSIDGTYIPKGIRVGPKCPPASSLSSPAGLRDCWGEGMYTGQHFTYRILPTPGANNNLEVGDIVQSIGWNAGSLPTAFPYKLTLSQSDNTVSPRPTTSYVKNGNTAIQLDYPRCVEVRLNAASEALPIVATVTVYGYDFYMQPMTDQIVCQAQVALTPSPFKTNKAFYGITDAYITNITGVPSTAFSITFSIEVSNRFGLPYKLEESAHLIAYSQGSVSAFNNVPAVNPGGSPTYIGNEASYIFPTWYPDAAVTAGATLYPWLISYPALVQAGNTFLDDLTSIDPRGLFEPQNKLSHTSPILPATGYPLETGSGDWSASAFPFLSFTYYVAGGDNFQDQMVHIQDSISQLGNSGVDPAAYQSSFKSMWRTKLPRVTTAQSLKGSPQYYQAPPA